METKTYKATMNLKQEGDEPTGEFEAIFATLNVVDLDGDVTLDGAFKPQKVVIEPWNHGWELPAGAGVISVVGDEAKVNGKFFLDTQAGIENYRTVKNLDDLAEWSYTFKIINSEFGELDGEPIRYLKEMDVIGVSPVTRGAGIGTRTNVVKSASKSNEDSDKDKGEAGNGNASNSEIKSDIDLDVMLSRIKNTLIVNEMEL